MCFYEAFYCENLINTDKVDLRVNWSRKWMGK
jgi:hypothetical protein